MPQKNKLALGIGLALIGVAFIVAIAVLYISGQAAMEANQRLSSLEVELANLISERAQEILGASDASRVRRKPIILSDFLAKAETIYGKEERNRKEGVLWVDRKAETYMVTLGAVNGLKRDNMLEVFDGDNKIGEITIDFPFDIISYAKPVNLSFDDFVNNYYRVVVTDQP